MNRRGLLAFVVVIGMIAAIGWFIGHRSRPIQLPAGQVAGQHPAVTPPDQGPIQKSEQLRSVEELQVLYPELFNRLDTSVYTGEPFDGRAALRDLHSSPFSQRNRDAYEAIVRAMAVHLRTIPDDCVTEIAAYDGASREQREPLDIGDIPPDTLEKFLKVRSALIEGLRGEQFPAYFKREALVDVQMAPRLFSKPALLQQLEAFSHDGSVSAEAASAANILATIQQQPPRQPAKWTQESTVCKLTQ